MIYQSMKFGASVNVGDLTCVTFPISDVINEQLTDQSGKMSAVCV